MRRPKLPRPNPDTSGFNKPRIAIAAAVVVSTLGVVTYLLTRSSEEPIVSGDPPVGLNSRRPPRELLEELPEAEPPEPPPFLLGRVLSDDEPSDVPPPAPEPEVSERVKKAFSERIAYSRRQTPAPTASARRAPAAVPGDLASVLGDLESQNRALGELLSSSPSALPPGSLERLEETLARGAPAASATQPTLGRPPVRRPPATRHQVARSEGPGGPFVLRQGTVLPAQLLTEINSDLPGQVLAQISSDVRDSLAYRHLLLPRGTKLVGAYDSGLVTGQNRLAVAWTRFLLPDGSSIDVAELPAVDAQGRSGLRDRVNHHTGRIFGNALLLSLLSAGFEAAQPSDGQLRLSAGELAVDGASRELERAASEILRRNASIPPTVRIRAGTAFGVFLTGDLTFAAPYS